MRPNFIRKLVILGALTGLAILLVTVLFFGDHEVRDPQRAEPEIAPPSTLLTITPFEPDSLTASSLHDYLDRMADMPELRHASWGFFAIPVFSDTVVAAHNANMSLIPASVMKVVTTGVALDLLGPDARFETLLQYEGTLDTARRVLFGNIVIRGGGDPSLGSEVFGTTRRDSIIRKWVRAIRAAGIDTVYGSVIGDARAYEYDMIPAGWAWEDMQSGYCAGASGLSFNENVYNIQVEVQKDTFRMVPDMVIPDFSLVSNLKTGKDAPGNAIWVSGSPYMNKCFVQGYVSPDSTKFGVKCQVPDPAYLCAYTLYGALKRKGVYVRDSANTMRRLNRIGSQQPERKTLLKISSPPLLDLITYTNTVSQNFYAESILKKVALEKTGFGSTVPGADIIRSYWQRKGLDVRGFYQVDGSGLSRFDIISPSQLARMLQAYGRDTTLFNEIYGTLPVAGRTGTLRGLCFGTRAEANVHAKSGYMSRVRSYAGYVHTRSGRLLAFAMMANNFECTPLMMRHHFEKLMALMAEME
ncbi:MAG: D-alanyl-D-alanine carboxypeptidase/D-alanyl-D-alanine-endopeptidase [Flavobacteriales bacterium]|nr:D-alanyl-D-alanine carboxypeptidase/D-alanyl-D-alanine-endopeptidase [Flavobacteriales bacterium]MCB9447595.1 D-alanyl-D-alanine carboxypeptidase/D-alanyl-D-alanine-endopeptidase [Flavobacteriales bacterium]